jgi:hypothetical protein
MIHINANKPELFENLAQYEFDGILYDLHNDYYCERISFSDEEIKLEMISLNKVKKIFLTFSDARVVKFDVYFLKESKAITLDTLYRGRYELDGNLHEFDKRNLSYYYLEFYEGQKFEFYCGVIHFELV